MSFHYEICPSSYVVICKNSRQQEWFWIKANLIFSSEVKHARFTNIFPLGLSAWVLPKFLQRFFTTNKVLLTELLIKRAFYWRSLNFNINLNQQILLKYPTVSLKSLNIAICIIQNYWSCEGTQLNVTF